MAGGEKQDLANKDQANYQATTPLGPPNLPPPSQGTHFPMGYTYGAYPNYPPNYGQWSPYGGTPYNPPPHPYPPYYGHPNSLTPPVMPPNMHDNNHQYPIPRMGSYHQLRSFNQPSHVSGNVAPYDGARRRYASSVTAKIFRKIKEADAASDKADDAVVAYVSQKARKLAHSII